MSKRFAKNDRVFLGTVFLILLVCCGWFYFFGREKGAFVRVTVDGQLYGSYSLEKDQTIEIIIGENVTNTLRIQDKKADMISADCPDKLCVHQKAVSRQKETIVCLPNRVVVEVVGGEETAEIDSVT